MKSPIVVKDYCFPALGYSANRKFKGEAASFFEISESIMDLEIRCSPSHEPEEFFVFLSLKIPHNDSPLIPYEVHAEVIGSFAISPDYSDDKEKLAVVTGGSILYSALREAILSVTGRGPFPKLKLPSISLLNLSKQASTESGDDTNANSSEEKTSRKKSLPSKKKARKE